MRERFDAFLGGRAGWGFPDLVVERSRPAYPPELERPEPIREVTELLDLAISRARANRHLDASVKDLVRGALEAARQEITHVGCRADEAPVRPPQDGPR